MNPINNDSLEEAKTSDGKKITPVDSYTRVVDGKKITVRAHRRSNPNTSKGEKK